MASSSSNTGCASCKSKGRNCTPECLLPADNLQQWPSVYQVYRESNEAKLQESERIRDPVYGSGSDILQKRIREESERLRDPVYGSGVDIRTLLFQKCIREESERIQTEIEISKKLHNLLTIGTDPQVEGHNSNNAASDQQLLHQGGGAVGGINSNNAAANIPHNYMGQAIMGGGNNRNNAAFHLPANNIAQARGGGKAVIRDPQGQGGSSVGGIRIVQELLRVQQLGAAAAQQQAAVAAQQQDAVAVMFWNDQQQQHEAMVWNYRQQLHEEMMRMRLLDSGDSSTSQALFDNFPSSYVGVFGKNPKRRDQ